MGVPDNSILDLIEKVKSWISWGKSDLNSISGVFEMSGNFCKTCWLCKRSISDSCLKYQCLSCRRLLCQNCVQGQTSTSLDVVASGDMEEMKEAIYDIKFCMFCLELGSQSKNARICSGKVHPSDSPRQSPDPPSPSFSGERFDCDSPSALTRSSDMSFSNHTSPVYGHRSPSRSDDDEEEESASQFFSTSSEYLADTSDVDLSSVSARHDNYSFMSVGSSPSDSPSRIQITSTRVGYFVQQEQWGTPRSQNNGPFVQDTMAVLRRPDKGTGDRENVHDQNKLKNLQKSFDIGTNSLIWLPPPPHDMANDVESNLFTYDDDDDEVGESGAMFSSTDGLDSMFLGKEKRAMDLKGPLRNVVHGHFRALVSQLLQGENIKATNENCDEDWLDIITTIAWQAAKFVKPDTTRGGSMDPCDYVKIKCVASGSPIESKFVKGVVCTKNIKHKRMTSLYKNPRLLLLAGALEYQRVPNQLASFNTLLQQENDHLKMIVSKIEAHRPNVLLVEKSVSSFAQEHLLAKEISLVLNVKRPLLERIARCTGATIAPSTDHISAARLGHCELFHLEKVLEDHEPKNQFNKKPSKTLMFFEGCPRRLGCTVVLKGSCREELKKMKHVVQYAIFAAYHLSLETSFLADEGASLPKMTVKSSIDIPKTLHTDDAIPVISDSFAPTCYLEERDVSSVDIESRDLNLDLRVQESLPELDDASCNDEYRIREALSQACDENLALNIQLDAEGAAFSGSGQEEGQSIEISEVERGDEIEASNEFYSASDNQQSILVSFSNRDVLNGNVCERSRLIRIKFYGSTDKPLGRYLRDDIFDQTSSCQSCKGSSDSHVICYTHQRGNLTINVRRLSALNLPGERDGKIWMWHRCLKCADIDGVPPSTHRVIMSDAAWGLSFGKFLELSFSNHATGNRVASCGHSLQRDCLRFYGFGSMVAFFQYSPIDILSVYLPPSILEFSSSGELPWLRKEASELWRKVEDLYTEISGVLHEIERKSSSLVHEYSDASEMHNHIMELQEMVMKEKNYFKDSLQISHEEIPHPDQAALDILAINRLRHSLLIGSHFWDRRLYLLDSLLKRSSSPKAPNDANSKAYMEDGSIELGSDDSVSDYSNSEDYSRKEVLNEDDSLPLEPGFLEKSISMASRQDSGDQVLQDEEDAANNTSLERLPSAASILSDQIDSAWTGSDQPGISAQLLETMKMEGSSSTLLRPMSQKDNPSFRRLKSPARVYSFDSAQRLQDRISKGLPPSSLHMTTLKSFHASGDYKYMIRDPLSNVKRTYSQISPREAEKLDLSLGGSHSYISSIHLLPEGARIMVPQSGQNDIVVTVYDDEPTSIVSYALGCKEYEEWVADKPIGTEGGSAASQVNKVNSIASELSTWQSFGSLDLDYVQYGSYGSEDASTMTSSFFGDAKRSPHLRISFEDDSSHAGGKVKFSVTCYFAKQFDALRKRCCANQVDFIRSLSRCRRWSAQGGKSNVYFAKSLDERFIVKQVTKTELESFEEFAPEYFKYLTDSLSSGSPTCLAKVLGIFQVTVKYARGGKEMKMDLMIMENLFFRRSISRVYDLKGSARSRYNSDTTGRNKVLLDMNLLETLRTQPIFLGGKAKRILERAVWNDTSFLASVDVMDYSLLVGVDDENKELIIGIIDFMRQYTWDKHLETWVKASGILGGPKNASPTIISPKQYKKRFRKAMTSYFLTVPDQWSS